MQASDPKSDQTAPGVMALALAAGADPVLNKRQTAALINVSTSTLDRMIDSGKFPKPLELSTRRVGWLLSTVTGWTTARSPGPSGST